MVSCKVISLCVSEFTSGLSGKTNLMEALIDANFGSEINMRHKLNHSKPTSGFKQTLPQA